MLAIVVHLNFLFSMPFNWSNGACPQANGAWNRIVLDVALENLGALFVARELTLLF